MLGDISCGKIYIRTGYTDMRTPLNGLVDEGSGFVYSVPRKIPTIPEIFHSIVAAYFDYCRKIGNRPITVKYKERMLYFV